MSIKYGKGEDRVYITLNRPEAHNTLTEEMVYDIAEALNRADDDEDVLSIIVIGAGEDAFCAGGDLESMIPAITSGEFPLG